MSTTLFRGGQVYSTTAPFASAVVIDEATIAWVGSDAAADRHLEDMDEVVDLEGAWLAPAFVDAHVHTTSTGLHLGGLDLAGVDSCTEALIRLRDAAEQHTGGVLLGHGWDESTWPERRPPTSEEIDEAAPGLLVYLSRVDVHSCVASSLLIDRAGAGPSSLGYRADGWLSADAHHLVRRVALDSVTVDQRRAAQRRCLDHAASLGIAMLHELGGPAISSPDDFADLLADVAPASGLDVLGYWGEGGGPAIAASLRAVGAAGDHFVDGAIGSRTAFLREPYTGRRHLWQRVHERGDDSRPCRGLFAGRGAGGVPRHRGRGDGSGRRRIRRGGRAGR